MSIRVQNLDVVVLFFCREVDFPMLLLIFQNVMPIDKNVIDVLER